MFMHLFSVVVLLCTFSSVSSGVIRGFADEFCDPHTITTDYYPSMLVGLSVEKTSPLKLKATFRLPNNNRTFSFEGIVFSSGFPATAAVAACRSLGCSKSPGFTTLSWVQQTACEFTCPDGAKAMQPCRYMMSRFVCPDDAMSLLECVTNEAFWTYANILPSTSNPGVDLKCLECGD